MKFNRIFLGAGLVLATLFSFTNQAVFAQGFFIRGDANCDGVVTWDDTTAMKYIFTGNPVPPCKDALDLNDNGFLTLSDFVFLIDYLSNGTPVPPPPFPLCGKDPTADGLDCLSDCCPNHFKAYSLRPRLFNISVFTEDQFMQDNLFLTGPILLANPVQKDSFPMTDIRQHLHWYFAEGRDTVISLSYKNQFESTGVTIDSVRWLLVPTQKQPHPPAPPESVSHFKCYRIQQSVWLQKQPAMQDQFLPTEGVDSLRRDLFCAPCQKNTFLPYDTITHYVAYQIAPGTPFIPPLIRQAFDQFGPWVDTVQGSKYLLVPTIKFLPPPPPPPDSGKQHYKTWRIQFQPVNLSVTVSDQFISNGSMLLDRIDFLSNPVEKIVPGDPPLVDTFSILKPNNHLTWYKGSFGSLQQFDVEYVNQFESTTVVIEDSVPYLLVPTQKFPHPRYDSLDHYRAYNIINPRKIIRKHTLEDQFDSAMAIIENIDSLEQLYFLAPASKNNEVMFDTITHYTVYRIFPPQPIPGLSVGTEDQFGPRTMFVMNSEMLMVPTIKKRVGTPPPCDTGNNHYKTWILSPPQGFGALVNVKDQFMTDNLDLFSISFLSNPVRKIVPDPIMDDTFDILDPDDHLTWYGAVGTKDTVIQVEYKNQFESTTVVIDSVRWLLVPTQKEGHVDSSDCLDHYKCYYIRNPKWLKRPPFFLQDQFDLIPPAVEEQIDSLQAVYFCTPCTKDNSQRFDTLTHYVAYYFAEPPRPGISKVTRDQFGFHSLSFGGPWGLLVPTEKLSFGTPGVPECSDGLDNDGDLLVDFPADCGCTGPADPTEAPDPVTQCNDGVDNDLDGFIDFPSDLGCSDPCDNDEFNPVTDTGPNHFKTWLMTQPQPFNAIVLVQDQFVQENLMLDTLYFLSNPVRKVVGIDTFDVTDSDEHLKWYRARGRNDLKKVIYENQFESTTVEIDSVKFLLVPAQKLPHPKPESLDHYKAYRIRNPQQFTTNISLQDQFDLTPEQITTLEPRFFLTPAKKNNEPRYDTLTHYLAYALFPPRVTSQMRQVIDQFGLDTMIFGQSVMLLVPTDKLCDAIPGDATASGSLTLADVISIVNYVFNKPGCSPQPICWLSGKLCRGTTDGNCAVTLADVIRLVNYIFAKPCAGPGTPPCCWKPLPCPGSTCCLPVPGCP